MNLTFLLQGPMGIAGPILLILLVLWMAGGTVPPGMSRPRCFSRWPSCC